MTCEVRNKEINSQCAELLVRPSYMHCTYSSMALSLSFDFNFLITYLLCGLFLKHPYKRFCFFILFIFTSRDLSLFLSLSHTLSLSSGHTIHISAQEHHRSFTSHFFLLSISPSLSLSLYLSLFSGHTMHISAQEHHIIGPLQATPSFSLSPSLFLSLSLSLSLSLIFTHRDFSRTMVRRVWRFLLPADHRIGGLICHCPVACSPWFYIFIIHL